jgi:hypothetical protein
MGNREEKRLRLMQSREQNVHLNYQKQKLAKMKNWYGNSTGMASIKKQPNANIKQRSAELGRLVGA